MSANMKILRGGIVGAGAWSRVQLDAWAAVKGAKITALCDRHPDRSASIVDKYGIEQVYTDCAAMLEKGQLDFLDVCTRPYSHEELVTLAVRHGVPVLCQKPFCESLEVTENLCRMGSVSGIPICVNENFRWQAWYRKIKELLDNGAIGAPFFARFLERDTVTMPGFQHPQKYLAEMPNLLLYEMGVHYLDTFRFIFGEPESLFARTHQISRDVAGEDAYVVVLNYNGLTATIQNSWASLQVPGFDTPPVTEPFRPPPIFEIEGTGGTLLLSADRRLSLYTHDGHSERWTFPMETRLLSRASAQQHFVECLVSGQESETSAQETIRTMKLVYAAYESAKTGKVVSL